MSKNGRDRTELTTFFATQQLQEEFWPDASDDFREALGSGNLKVITDTMISGLEAEGWEVAEAYSILHDRDTRSLWDETAMKMVLDLKPSHIHLSVKFTPKKNRGAVISAIATALGIPPNNVERPKAGRYSWDNQLAYLIHAKDEDKHAYSPDDVYVYKGKGYRAIYEESKDRWERGRAKKTNERAKVDIDLLESKILGGEITRSEIILSDEYYKVYAQFKRRVDDAFDTYAQRKIYKTIQAMENGEEKLTVYYVTGKPGSGKTRFVNSLITEMIEDRERNRGERWSVCKAASTNPVDDYEGEEILLMDDVRGSTMRADDWLKLLDPWNISPSSARYRNKVVAPKVIFITATISPHEFFYYTKGVGGGAGQAEAVDQFIRRLKGVLHVYNFPGGDVAYLEPAKTDVSRQIEVGWRDGEPLYVESNYGYSLDKYDGDRAQNLMNRMIKDVADATDLKGKFSNIIEADTIEDDKNTEEVTP